LRAELSDDKTQVILHVYNNYWLDIDNEDEHAAPLSAADLAAHADVDVGAWVAPRGDYCALLRFMLMQRNQAALAVTLEHKARGTTRFLANLDRLWHATAPPLDAPLAAQPRQVVSTLRRYQRQAVHWMLHREASRAAFSGF
jgi:hypothetical protein